MCVRARDVNMAGAEIKFQSEVYCRLFVLHYHINAIIYFNILIKWLQH